jgi:hypothetical protein
MNTLHTLEDAQKVKRAPDTQVVEHAGTLVLLDAEKIPEAEELDDEIDMRTRKRIARGFELSVPSMNSLVEQLAPGIKNGTWSTILGDDAKGRLPTLVIGELANRWGCETNQARPARKFIAGGRRLSVDAQDIDHSKADRLRQANLNEYVSKIKPELGKRVLLVTEYIGSGRGMKALLGALSDNDIPFDLAIVDSWGATDETKDQLRDQYSEILDGANIYIGQGEAYRGSSAAFAYDNNGLAGATGVSRTELAPVSRTDIVWGESVKAARKEVHKMVNSFYCQFFQLDQEIIS